MADLSTVQMATLVVALQSSSDATVVTALAERNAGALADWLNTATATKAWPESVTRIQCVEVVRVATYDGLAAGNRTIWQMLLDCTPLDLTRAKTRKAILDVFGTTDGNGMLEDFTERASQAEELLGGTSATTGTVAALKRTWIGRVGARELRAALFPEARRLA